MYFVQRQIKYGRRRRRKKTAPDSCSGCVRMQHKQQEKKKKQNKNAELFTVDIIIDIRYILWNVIKMGLDLCLCFVFLDKGIHNAKRTIQILSQLK